LKGVILSLEIESI